MRRVRFVSALVLLVSSAYTLAQNKPVGPAGTWRVNGVGAAFPWEIALRIDEPL